MQIFIFVKSALEKAETIVVLWKRIKFTDFLEPLWIRREYRW